MLNPFLRSLRRLLTTQPGPTRRTRLQILPLEERVTPAYPTVASIVTSTGSSGAAASTSAVFTVTFSDAVTGVDAADFTTVSTGTTAGTIASVTGSDAIYTVTVNSISGNGTLGLNLVDNGTIAATVSFAAKTDFATGDAPLSVTLGDVNGDGKLDLVTANYFAATASVLLGDGDGSFGSKTDFATGAAPRSVTLGDVNGDGKLDLVTANLFADTASVLLGNGAGSFGSKTDFATGGATFSVTLGDVNGDGKLDLVTANLNANTASVLLNSIAFIGQTYNISQNSAPTDISLSNSTVAENQASGTAVGDFSTTDVDAGNTFTYTLVSGTGDTGNASFQISGNVLQTAASFNFEAQSSYSVLVRTTDQGGLFYEKAFTIGVTNVNETPSFVTGADQNITATNSVQSVSGWATVIEDGDATVTQGLTFNITGNTNAGLFATPPAINSFGTLTYTPNFTTGTATISVTLTDDATINGNPALTSAETTFIITISDVVAPETTIDLAPSVNAASFISSTTAQFAFSGTDDVLPLVLTFEASLDGAAFATATSPITFNGLSQGSHTFQVRARDVAGNVDQTPASFTWTVDTIAPTVAIGAPSQGYANSAATVTYVLTYADLNLDGITLTPAGISLNAPMGVSASVAVNITGPNTANVVLTNITGDGTLGISVATGTAVDAAGNQATGAGPSAVVIVDNTLPSLTIGAPSVATTRAGPVSWVVTLADTNALLPFTLTPAQITLVGSPVAVTANSVVVTALTATTVRVTVNDVYGGQGILRIRLAAGVVTDLAGNQSAGPVDSASVNVTGKRKLRVSHVRPPARLTAGTNFTFRIGYRNAGTQLSSGVVLEAQLPAWATFRASASDAGWVHIGGGKYQLTIGNLNVAQRGVAKFAVTYASSVPRGASTTFSARLTDYVSGSLTAVATTSTSIFGFNSRWN